MVLSLERKIICIKAWGFIDETYMTFKQPIIKIEDRSFIEDEAVFGNFTNRDC